MRTSVDPAAILDKTIHAFAEGLGQLDFNRSVTLKEFERSYSLLAKGLAERAEEGPRVRGHSTRMYFVDLAKTGTVLDPRSSNLPQYVLANAEANDEHLLGWLADGLNGHLRWFLVTAFENHERFLKDVYAAAGFLDSALWRIDDFGDVPLADAASKDLAWHAAQVRRKHRHGCDDILSQLKKVLPGIGIFEKANWIETETTDHRFWRAVIEYFRHVIVHAGGEAADSDFWTRIAEKTGCSFAGTSDRTTRRTWAVGRFTTLDNGVRSIQLVDRSTLASSFFQLDRKLRELWEVLTNFSCLVYACAAEHFGLQPFWRRT